MTSDDATLQPRMELAPEIVEADRPENQPVKDVAFPEVANESELDVAMWRQLQDAKKRQADFEARLGGKSIEFDGRTYSAKERAIQSVRNDRAVLDRYRQHRLSRGEKPFQYLEQGQRLERDQQFRDRLPFFVQMFSGPESFEQAFPEEHRAAVSDRFKGSLNPARDKMQTANMMLVSEQMGKPVKELQKLWPAYRNQYAALALGANGPVDEAGFYALAGKKLVGEKADNETAESIAKKVREMALSTRPLGDAMEEAKKLAGDRWKEFQPSAKAAYAGVLAEYEDEELATGRELFQHFAKLQGGKPVEQVTDSTTAFFNYAKMPQEQRERVLGLIASQAEAEGEDIDRFFKTAGGNVEQASMGSGSTLLAFKDRDTAKLYQRILDRGTLPLPREDEKARPIDQWDPAHVEAAWVTGNLQGAKTRPLTQEERGQLETAQGLREGRSLFLGDMRASGLKMRRYLDDGRNKWWQRIDDYTLMAIESLPTMAFAAAPYGAGLLPLVVDYGERNLAEYRSQMPDADPATLGRMAYTSAALEAGIDRVQWFTLGARVPKMNAALLKWGRPGALGVFATRAIGVGVAETGQEVVQDFTAPAVQELAAALSEDIKGPNWQKVLEREREALGDIFAVSMVFGIIGGAGSTAVEVIQAPKLKAALTDRQGLTLAGFTPETVEAVSKLAETNPAAAAETLKAAAMETPVEVRKANSEAARAKLEANPLPTPEEALIPAIEKRDDGGYQVRYPDGRVDSAESEMDAIEAVRMWEDEDLNRMDIANRALARELERSHADNPELGVNFKFTGKEMSMESWAGDSAQKIEVARQRVRIAMRDEFVSGGSETDGSEIADADLPLGAYLILGTSQNFGGAVTRIAAEIHKQGNVATVLEEHAEGVVKWLMSSGRYSRADVIRGIRETEAATGKQTLADNLDSLSEDASERAIVEAFSRLAVANAFGKVPESGLSAKFKALFRALKEAFSAVLSLAGQIREIQLAGQMDEQFEYWLDVAGGVSERYQMENLQKAAERELQEAAMEGFPEVAATLKGKLPRHETLRQQGSAFAGEVERLYDSLRNSSTNGASPAARTRVANEFFLPVGEMADLDQLRVAANAKGFAFETPGDMIDALDLSVNYGRPQYGLHAETDGETFSIGRTEVTPSESTRVFSGADGSPSVIGPATFSISAFHGTPHKVDRFSTEKMGTGEGSQAYGWGLYFTATESIATHYRDSLSLADWFVDGAEYDPKNPDHFAAATLAEYDGQVERAIADLEKQIAEKSRINAEWAKGYVRNTRAVIARIREGGLPELDERSQISQLEGLMLYLTMRQPDQAKKLERLGYDDKTMAQLEAWLKPEVKNLGSWMVDFLGADTFTVDALHRSEKGVALPLVENYFPVRNDVSGSDSGGLSLDGAGQQQSGRSVSFVKQRVANNAPPAYVNALSHLDGATFVNNYQAALQNKFNTAITSGGAPTPSWVVVGPPAGYDDTVDQANSAQAAAQKALAISRDDVFFDNRLWMGSAASAVANGYLPPGDVHPTAKARAYWLPSLFRQAGICDGLALGPVRRTAYPLLGGGNFRTQAGALGLSKTVEFEGNLRMTSPPGTTGGGVIYFEDNDSSGPTTSSDVGYWHYSSDSMRLGIGGSPALNFDNSGGNKRIYCPAATTGTGSNGSVGVSSAWFREVYTTSINLGYAEKSANYTLTQFDHKINVTSGSPTITLPSASGIFGREYVIMNTGAGTVTIATTSSQNIDGAAPGTLGPAGRLRVVSSNSHWFTW